jgi:MGT family glycosyltransferase
MSRVVFLNISAPGHVNPTLGLVVELINRGEEVTYYENPYFQKEIEALGASFRSNPPLKEVVRSQYNDEFSIIPALTWTAAEMLPSLIELIREQKPDYIIHDSLCLWGRLIAQILNIPAVNSIATAAFCPRMIDESPELRKKTQEVTSEESFNMKEFRKYERVLIQTYGIPPLTPLETFTNPEPLNICYLPRELQPYADKFDESFHFVGPCNPIRAIDFDFPMDQLCSGKLILISFGTAHDPGIEFYKICLEIFRDIDAQVLLVLSPTTDRALLGDIPPNFIIKPTGTIPQLKILEHTSLFITHGAGGGAREGVWYGVPMIAIPQTYEQQLISRRIQQEGAGIMILPNEVNPKRLSQAAQQILNNESFRANSGRIGNACRTAGGAKRAADEIMRYIEDRLE